MRLSLVLIAALLTVSAGPAVVGQQKFSVVLKELAPGEAARMERKDASSFKTRVIVDPKENAKEVEQTAGKVQVFNQEILERPAGADRPTKLQRTYEKAIFESTGPDGKKNSAILPQQGKTVLIEKTAKGFEFRDGKEVLKDNADLEGEFNAPMSSDRKKLLLPEGPVAQGDTWKIDPRSFISADAGQKLEVSKALGTARLVKVFRKDGAIFGTIETEIECDFRISGGIPQEDGDLTSDNRIGVKLKFDGCIDGSRFEGSVTSVAQFTNTTVFQGRDKMPPRTTIVRGTSRYEESWQPLARK